MNYTQISLVLISITIIGFGCVLFNVTRKKTYAVDKNTFVVGTAAGYAPYVSINERGEYEGFDIDVINTIAKSLNKKLILKDLGSMTSLMIALEQGTIDAIIWGVSITQNRLQKYAMIHYQGILTDSYPLIFWSTIPSGVHTLADLEGFTVCVEPSSSQSAIVERYATINMLPVEKVDDALLNIQYGKADAALLDPVIANKFKKKSPEIKILPIQLALEDQVQGVGIVLRKTDVALVAQIQYVVNELRNNGALKALELKWSLE